MDGDIILRTDGATFNGVILYEVTFELLGLFAEQLDLEHLTIWRAHRARTEGDHPECDSLTRTPHYHRGLTRPERCSGAKVHDRETLEGAPNGARSP